MTVTVAALFLARVAETNREEDYGRAYSNFGRGDYHGYYGQENRESEILRWTDTDWTECDHIRRYG